MLPIIKNVYTFVAWVEVGAGMMAGLNHHNDSTDFHSLVRDAMR